ncbi:MAG: hypothetical protein KBS81_06860 [Spirochaetales bacterium]|nr:hypothetical protein [Candidatus Physcosoma equi]
MAVASLVLGILSILLPLRSFGLLSPFCLVFGILSIVFGAISRKDPQPQKKETGGLIIGIVGLVISLLVGFYWLFLGYGLWSFFWF